MGRALKAVIDLSALQYNLIQTKNLSNNRSIMAMVKANGYGHGLVTTARALHLADAFGVACIEEAITLREASISQRIVLMEGFFKSTELADIVRFKFEPVLNNWEQIAALHHYTGEAALHVWVKINTGMNRLGFKPNQVPLIVERLQSLPHVKISGWMSHFAKADQLHDQTTLQQIECFNAATDHLKGAKSLANSAGILGWPSAHADWVRPGIMLYGVSPFKDRLGYQEGLRPVMTLQSELIAIHDLNKNDEVGYGGKFVCPEAMRIGIVAIGYGDGYPMAHSEGVPVYIQGKKVPIIGRVSMDMIAIDLRAIAQPIVGEKVILWGPELPVEEVAMGMKTLAYELLAGLSSRVPLEIMHSEETPTLYTV